VVEKHAYIIGQGDIVYPESDGQPIADNTKQFRWIMTIQGGLEAMFRDTPDVFVAEGELQIIKPNGRPFLTYVGLQLRAEQAEMIAEAERARAERLAARLRALDVDADGDEGEEGA
jgi:hypothetical protein